MRSPSDRLVSLLTSTGLCSRAELDHCEPCVRRLCHDLPDFESVWLDALVQQRLLTPWQAEQLQEEESHNLLVGRFVLQERVGQATFLARDKHGRQSFVLRQLSASGPQPISALQPRLADLMTNLDRSRRTAPGSILLPAEIATRDRLHADSSPEPDLFLISPLVPGWSMEELLIRGGRLPAPVVAEIGRELLAALAWLEAVGLLHGNLVARNVRLTPRGEIRLTDPFTRRLTQPQFALTEQLTLRDCEGIAPEQVGTGRTPDARSELYALGCLLWQLLTSRPVVLTSDPVTRLMKQQDQDIADVRGAVPDCPEWMSRLIQSMTRRTPELRPASAADVLKVWRTHVGRSCSECRALARQMPDHAVRARSRPLIRNSRNEKLWKWPAAAMLVLTALVIQAARSGILPNTLQLSFFSNLQIPSASRGEVPESRSDQPRTLHDGPVPLPAIDADGLIRLEPGTQYIAKNRAFPGELRIVCEQSPMATMLIPKGQPWMLNARSVVLQGLSLEQQQKQTGSDNSDDPVSRGIAHHLLAVQCETLTISGCVVQSPSSAWDFAGVAWDSVSGEPGVVVIRDTVFSGGGYGIAFTHPPRRCELENVLLSGRGGGLICEFQKGDSETWDLSCRNVTQRFGFSVLDVLVHSDSIRNLSIGMTSIESVYEPQMAIMRLQAPESLKPEAMRVRFRSAETGNPAIVPPTTQSVVYIDRSLGQPVSLPEAQIAENNLLLAELTFDQSPDRSSPGAPDIPLWANAALIDFEGPKLTQLMPGVDIRRLPRQQRLTQ